MARGDREPGRREKGLSVRRPTVSHSALIKAHKGERMQDAVGTVERHSAADKAAKIGNH